jgi:tRNA pseudouridine55 synthase
LIDRHRRKKNGVPLYRLARKGEVIEREARDVEIFSLEILRILIPDVDFRVVCSKGTYVRSICNDAGALLGCGGHLTGLRRMQSGPFRVDNAPGPDADPEALKAAIIPLGEALVMAEAPAEALGMAMSIG